MSVDWARGDLTHTLAVLVVDPTDLVTVRGELGGVTGGKLDLQYYGDTRMGAELVTVGDHGWDGSGALRLVHDVSDHTGLLLRETLFTGFVTGASWDGEGDSRRVTWSLSSTLYALQSTVASQGYSVARGTKALSVVRHVCEALDRPYEVGSAAREYAYGSNKVYEAGTNYLSLLFDVCDRANDRLTVDADGIVVVDGYEPPSGRAPDFDSDERDARGSVVGPVSGDVSGFDTPARVVVRAESGNRTVTGVANVPSGSPLSAGVRGYKLDRFETVSDLSPFTQAAARALAQRYLDNDLNDVPSISHGLTYRPLREGMVERLTMADGSTARWMVTGARLDLNSWTWELDLKGGWE